MNCVVTAGPTYEPLDEVRRLTNFSTGKLGTSLADYLVEQGHDVILLRGHYSVAPISSKVEKVVEFGPTAELENHLQSLTRRPMDAVFHAAAVSDFRFGKVWTRSADGRLDEIRKGKLSTQESPLLAELVPTPKVIANLRRWFPAARLVGWKYEVDGDQASAWVRANQQISENRTDVCVVNGAAYGEGFGVLTSDGRRLHLADSRALFEFLAQFSDSH